MNDHITMPIMRCAFANRAPGNLLGKLALCCTCTVKCELVKAIDNMANRESSSATAISPFFFTLFAAAFSKLPKYYLPHMVLCREVWQSELAPILQLWKRLNQGSSNVIHAKVEMPAVSGESPVLQFVQLERYNAVRLVQHVHQTLSAVSKVMRGKL